MNRNNASSNVIILIINQVVQDYIYISRECYIYVRNEAQVKEKRMNWKQVNTVVLRIEYMYVLYMYMMMMLMKILNNTA